MIKESFVVQLDRHQYSGHAEYVNDILGHNAVKLLNDKTQGFIDCANINGQVISRLGDNAVILFDNAEDAHNFAVSVNVLTKEDNHQKPDDRQCWFTIGCSFGETSIDNDNPTGDAFTIADRLHKKAGLGELLIESKVYSKLLPELQSSYADREIIIVKNRRFEVHKFVIIPDLENKKIVLLLSSQPDSYSRKHRDKDFFRIESSIDRGSRNNHMFRLQNIARFISLQELENINPYIIHVSGCIDLVKLINSEYGIHNNSAENHDDSISEISREYLESVQCIVLHGSYLEEQIREFARYFKFVISVSEDFKEVDYLNFYDEFYYRLALGLEIEASHRRGCNSLEFDEKETSSLPKLFTRNDEMLRRKLLRDLDDLNKLIEKDSEVVEFWKRKGTLLKELGRRSEANDAYDKANGLDGTDYKVWWDKAKVLAQQQNHEEAANSYKKALMLLASPPPKDGYIICRDYAITLDALGKPHASVALYKKTLRLQPNYRIANYERKKIYKNIYSEIE